jgi:hypothetical protein
VYSLGIIAHELLTGRRPTDSLELDDELPEDTSPEQRTAIRRALSGALAENPDDRFQTPMAVVEALLGAPPLAVAADPVQYADVTTGDESGPEFGFEEPEAVPQLESEPESIWLPGPEADPEPEPEPERTPVRSTAGMPPFLGVPSLPDRREPFQPFIDAPKENAMPRTLVVAALALALGTGFGYWLRGPAPTPPPEAESASDAVPAAAPSVTKDEPIGTDVAVNQPASTALPTPAASPLAAAARATEPAATRGRLLVRSVPGDGTVTVNGRGSGTTPATIRDLPFGTYTVAVSRSGYQRREQRVTISKTVPAREITLELTPVAAARPSGRPAPGVITGSVLVETRPRGAAVAIDGRSVGTAPVRVPELKAGSHTVRVSLAGHKTVTTTAVVRAGQQTLVRLSLEIQ